MSSGINLPLDGLAALGAACLLERDRRGGARVAARIGLVELLLSGTTTAADHHYMFSDTYRFDPADVIFDAARDLGMRLVFCRGGATVFRTFDTPGYKPMPTEPLDAMIKSVEACAQRYHDPSPAEHDAASCSRRPHRPGRWRCRELKVVADAARRLGLRLHSHMSETTDYVDFCLWRNSASARSTGWPSTTGSGRTCGSLISSMSTRRRCSFSSSTGTGMAHCPQSNCRLGSGVAPADLMAAAGGAVSLAVDGAASNESADMISEMHSAWHTHRALKGAAATTVEDVVRWATVNGARVLGMPDIGVLAPGKLADLAVFDLASPRYFGLHDQLIGPVVGAGTPDLKLLMVGGRVVVENGAIPGFDLEGLRREAARVVTRLLH